MKATTASELKLTPECGGVPPIEDDGIPEAKGDGCGIDAAKGTPKVGQARTGE